MKSILLVAAAVVAVCTFLCAPCSGAPMSPQCTLPSTSCPGPLSFDRMVIEAVQGVQSLKATQEVLEGQKFFTKVDLDGQCALYSTSTPSNGLTCEKYFQRLSEDFKFLNRFNLHYRNEVCLPSLASMDYLEITVTREVGEYLDSAVCKLKNLLGSPRAKSFGITVDASVGQASCYSLSTDQFHTALKTQIGYTLSRLVYVNEIC